MKAKRSLTHPASRDTLSARERARTVLLASCFLLLAPSARAGEPGEPIDGMPMPPPHVSGRVVMIPYFNPRTGYFALAPAPPPTLTPKDMNQVFVSVFDATNNALRINNSLAPGGTHTPADANQVSVSVFDSTNNAMRVNCVIGCGSGTSGSGTAHTLSMWTTPSSLGNSSMIENATTGSITIQPLSGNNAVPLLLGPNVGSPTADLVDVYSNSALSTRAFSVSASGSTNSIIFDHDVHVDGTTYTSVANAIAGTPTANACSTTKGCTIYDELSSVLLTASNQNPFLGPINYEIHLGHGSETGAGKGIFWASVPIVLGGDQLIGSGRLNISSTTPDGSTGTLIKACAGDTTTPCGSTYFPTSPPPAPAPTITLTGTGQTGTLRTQISWVVNLHTGTDAGTTAGKYGLAGESMASAETVTTFTNVATATITAPCAATPCVFNGTGGNPPDFANFSTVGTYAVNTYVYCTGGTGGCTGNHLYRVMQAVSTITQPNFTGTANETINDSSANCSGGNSGSNACWYQESGPDANWLPVIGYNVYSTTGAAGTEVLQDPPTACTTTVRVGQTLACAVNSAFAINLSSVGTGSIGTPLTDTTHPLTAEGLTASSGGLTVVFGTRFENVSLDANNQASQCGLEAFSEELSGYMRIKCNSPTESFFTFLGSSTGTPTVGASANSTIQDIEAGEQYRQETIRLGGIVLDDRFQNTVRGVINTTVNDYKVPGGAAPACIYVAGTSFFQPNSANQIAFFGNHLEQCTDGIFIGGGSASIAGTQGSNSVTNVVHIGSNATGCSVSATKGPGSTNNITVLDDLNGVTFRSMAPYTCGQSGISAASTTPLTLTASDQQLAEVALRLGQINYTGADLQFAARGTYVNSTASNTYTIKIKLCPTSGCGSSPVTLGSWAIVAGTAGVAWPWEVHGDCAVTTTGTSGTLLCHGTLSLAVSAQTTPSLVMDTNSANSTALSLAQATFLDITASASGAAGTITANNWTARPND